MNPNPRILLIINGFYPKVGGSEKQAQMIAKGFESNGCKVQILTLQLEQKWPQVEQLDGINIRRISYPKIPLLGELISLAKTGWYLATTAKKWDVYYVVIVEYMAAIAAYVGKLIGIPVVLKFTGLGKLGVQYIETRKFSWFLKKMIGKADAFVGVTEKMKEEIEKYGFDREKIQLIPNAVDTVANCYTSEDKKRHLKKVLNIENKKTVIFAGRFVEVKDIPTLLLAWRQTIEKINNEAQLVLLGDGPLLKHMKKFSQKLGIEESVYFLGNRKDIHLFMQASDVGVISSKSEGLSNTLLEMMANQLVIVATDIEGNRSVIINKENGLLFPPEDVEVLSRMMSEVINNIEEYNLLGVNAGQLIKEKYSISCIVNNYKKLFSDIALQKVRKIGH